MVITGILKVMRSGALLTLCSIQVESSRMSCMSGHGGKVVLIWNTSLSLEVPKVRRSLALMHCRNFLAFQLLVGF